MWASIIAGLAKPVADVIDELHTSDEEKGKIRMGLMSMQVGMGQKLLEYETQRLQMKAEIIKAEAQSNSWITRSWRPLTMLVFLALVVAYFFGLQGENFSEVMAEHLFQLIKIGLGGYVVGRSAEKVVPKVAELFKRDNG
jgi:hypothetical protein